MKGAAQAVAGAVLLAALLIPAALRPARADVAQQRSFAVWRAMADCAHEAALKYPDHTPQGNAEREAARLECLRIHHLPVR
ncbi:MAG TPA: hypothetical protein VKV32_17630 [Stellaceae bacterium]|nr:hypothetical protein [Stellaceae bacterium]